MDRYQRDFFISRIDAGYLRWTVNNKLTLKIAPPTKDIIYESNEEYIKVYNDIEFEDLMTEEESLALMISSGVWTSKMEADLEKLPENIDILKVELYEAMYKKGVQKKLRKYLAVSKAEQNKLNGIKHSWDHYTKHGLASFARWQYVLENTVMYTDNTPYNWEHINTLTALSHYQSEFISEDIIRELAHTEPWSNIWQVRKLNSRVFDGEITTDQMRLASWSSMYDSVSQYPDCPPKSVLDDDDMMDGWLISQRKDKEKESKRHEVETKLSSNERISGAEEVFLPVNIHGEAKEIMDLNNPHGQMVVATRLKQVAEKGRVGLMEFSDMKQKLRMAFNQKGIDSMKGK